MTRPYGKRGLRPSPPTPELRLARFRAAAPAPPSGDVTNGITDWQMLGNDTYGDCGPAATMHNLMAKAATAGVYEADFVLPTDQSTESLYFAYGIAQGEPGPQPDQGVDNATWLKYLFDQGVIEGYAQLDPANSDEVHEAMITFNGVITGVQLTDDAEQLFAEHQPWTTAQGETADPSLGHDILLVAYDANGETYVTWGALQPSTAGFDAACVQDRWVIITKQDAERAGVDFAALQAAIRSWGGTQTAAPAAPATSSGLIERLKAEILAEVEKVIDSVLAGWVGRL